MRANIQKGAHRLRSSFRFSFLSCFPSTGMCCALNSEVTFKDTLFGSLVTEAEGEETEKRKVRASSGLRAGVSLVLALFDTLVFLLNEYFIELNTVNFYFLNKFLN